MSGSKARDLVTVFCKHKTSSRLGHLVSVYKTLVEFQKRNDREVLGDLETFITSLSDHPFDIDEFTSDYDVDMMMYGKAKAYAGLEDLREMLNPSLYALIELLWDQLVKGGKKRVEVVMQIMKRVLRDFHKKDLIDKHVLVEDKFDVYDLMWTILIRFLESWSLEEEIVKYVKISRTLFYFGARQKDRKERENLLLTTLGVLVLREVNSKKHRIVNKKDERMRYLFTLTHKNELSPAEYLHELPASHPEPKVIQVKGRHEDMMSSQYEINKVH
mgnify:CR=1 FL=1